MFGLMGLFGAACLLWGACIYLRLFLRRSRYDDPLSYAQALSLSRALDRRLAGCSLHRVGWLKFYANMLLPFLGIAGGFLLVHAVLSGAPLSPGAGVWLAAGGCALADLLFLRFYDRLSFCVNAAACLTLAAACFFPPPGGTLPCLPLWAALAVFVLCSCNLAYFWRRRALFSPGAAELSGAYAAGLSEAEADASGGPEAPGFMELPATGEPPAAEGMKAPVLPEAGQALSVRSRNAINPRVRPSESPARPLPFSGPDAPSAPSPLETPPGTPAAQLDWLLDQAAQENPAVSGAAFREDRGPLHAECPAERRPLSLWNVPAEGLFEEAAAPSVWETPGSAGAFALHGSPPRAGAHPAFARRALVTGTFLRGRQAHIAACVSGQAVVIRHLPDSRYRDYMLVSAVVEEGPPVELGNLGAEPSAGLCDELPLGAVCCGKVLRVFPGSDGLLTCEIAY